MTILRDSRDRALRNTLEAFDLNRNPPEQIFSRQGSSFTFFSSDLLFQRGTVKLMSKLLDIESSQVACLVNLDRTTSYDIESVAAVFFDSELTEDGYMSALSNKDGKIGWLSLVECYICSSDVGDWAIYCDKSNDFAILAVHAHAQAESYDCLQAELFAHPIEEVIQGGEHARFPFNDFNEKWRTNMVLNYKN